MNKKCAFTICAKNFIGLAQTLEKSLKDNNPDIDFVIFVADKFDEVRPSELSENVVIAKDICGITEADWRDMTFKYDIVEFCTSIKPFCMRYLLGKKYEIVMYFDPDILVFAPLTPVYEALEHHVVAVTPHNLNIDSGFACRGGIYNLGFLGLRQGASADRMLSWWEDRLRNHASVDPMRGLFTDQKWMDQLPVVLGNDELFVLRHPGLNYAPWNFDERLVVKHDNRFFIRFKNLENSREYPLLFLHYSAFKYKEISQKNFNHKIFPMTNREPELYNLIQLYGEKISENDFQKFFNLHYSYDVFSDGTQIQYTHRRIYKRLSEEGYTFANPFDADGPLFDLFRQKRMLSQLAFNPERINIGKIPNLDWKIKVIDILTLALIRVIGFSHFYLLARFMIRYLHLSNRARLLGSEFRKLKIETF
jgi:hypothetical protein